MPRHWRCSPRPPAWGLAGSAAFSIPLFPAVGNVSFAAAVLPAITLAIPTGAPLAHLLREPHIYTDQMLTGPGEGGADVGSPLRIAFTIISARGTRISPG